MQQISKLYRFKKKIERCDKILKNYVKRHKEFKYSDILHRAVNDAEIEGSSEEFATSVEDIPLLERLRMALQEGRDKEQSEDVVEEIIVKKLDNKQLEFIDAVPIYTEGPPPLIPIIVDANSNSNANSNFNSNKNSVIKADSPAPDLLVNAPPLVPIKALSAMDPADIVISTPAELKLTLTCTMCNEQFSSVPALKQHKRLSCQSSGLQCNICMKDFKDRRKLIGHLRGHMVVKDIACKICGKCYPNPSTFKIHMMTHTGERPFKCQICQKGFVRWSSVMTHMKTHSDDKPHKCDKCGKGFKMPSNLERHKVLHAGVLPYCCNFCGKTFSQADNLRVHIRTNHTNERPYLCNECGKGFVSSTRLKRHMWAHKGHKPYKCGDCPKTYLHSSDLKNHQMTHGESREAEKLYSCHRCDMRFFYLCRLRRHMQSHSRPFICCECNKTFSSEVALSRHLEVKHSDAEEQLDLPIKVEEVFIEYE